MLCEKGTIRMRYKSEGGGREGCKQVAGVVGVVVFEGGVQLSP
jgi:hypothetical protein